MFRVVISILFATTLFFVSGCEKRIEKKAVEVNYLLPDLQKGRVSSVTLSSPEGVVDISMRDERWWVNAPVDFPAAQNSVGILLNMLRYAEIGKPVETAAEEMSELNLDESGIEIGLRYTSEDRREQNVRLTVGQLSFPEDSRMGTVSGLGFIARRFIRVRRDSQDEVFLVPVSLVDLNTKPDFWTNTSFCSILSFRRIRFIEGSKLKREFSRSHLYGPLQEQKDPDQVKPARSSKFVEFEKLLKKGRCFRVGAAGKLDGVNDKTVVVEDFFGMSYTFRFGAPIAPTQVEREREALQAGFLNDGEAPTLVPFMLEVSHDPASAVVTGDLFADAIRKENLSIAKQLRNRIAYFRLEDCGSLIELFEELP